MRYIRFFDEIGREDLSLAGGKGANLGEMTRAGFPVPYGFCVTTEGYKAFVENSRMDDYINQALKDARSESIKQTGEKIREKFAESKIPEQVEQEVTEAMNLIGADGYYAVRSSATAEDLSFASFAGQQDTYLNIKGTMNILDSIRQCWASLFTERAIMYRLQNGMQHEKVFMSVVVQRMVLPEVSGIMFTADPVTGHRGILSIDAGFGLGEALVSGLVSPDIYKFNKAEKSICSKIIAEKKLAIMPVAGGGTCKTEITGDKSSSQVLDDSWIERLAELGIAIEGHYGCPQDIEWCMEKGKLYVVQSRAITSLYPLPSPAPIDGLLHTYASLNHFQVMTDPISPLGIDMLRLLLNFDKGARSAEDYKFIKSAGGRVYIDVSVLLQGRMFGRKIARALENVDALMSDALVSLISRPDFDARIKRDKQSARALLKFIFPLAVKAAMRFLFIKPEGTIALVNEYIDNRIKKAMDAISHANQGIEKLDAIYEAAAFTADFKALLPLMAPAMGSFIILRALEQKLLGTTKYSDLIVKGLEGNITTELGLLTGDLADLARKSDKVQKELENEDYRSLNERIAGLKGCDEFKEKFLAFMNKYDMRAAGEIDMAKDRWIENPEPLAKAILAAVRTSQEGIHRSEFSETVENAKRASEELIKEVNKKSGSLKSRLVKRVIRVLRNHLPIREHPKYLIMKLILTFKKAFLSEAEVLVKNGQLEGIRDIFYVGFWELYDAVKSHKNLTALVKVRKEEYRHFNKLRAPRVLTSDGEEIKGGIKIENLPEGSLSGMPASSGVIEGIARVVTDPSNAALNKGEILVAPFTDPGWTPLFINAAGLVMEVGGLLTHGTVVAREYGMPAVVGVTDATKKIKTGQKIRIDGNSGIVTIL